MRSSPAAPSVLGAEQHQSVYPRLLVEDQKPALSKHCLEEVSEVEAPPGHHPPRWSRHW